MEKAEENPKKIFAAFAINNITSLALVIMVLYTSDTDPQIFFRFLSTLFGILVITETSAYLGYHGYGPIWKMVKKTVNVPEPKEAKPTVVYVPSHPTNRREI